MKKNKIMHGLSEVAGQNCLSVRGLKEIGFDAQTVVYYPNPFGYPFDINLNIQKNKKILFPIIVMKLFVFLIFSLFRYDTYHFHYGRSICNNFDLWLLKIAGKDFFYEFHGSDIRNMEEFSKKSNYKNPNETPMSKKLIKRNNYICKKATGIILHDDELIEYLPKDHAEIYVVPLRVDISSYTPCYPKIRNDVIRIVHAPSKRMIKGTLHVLEAIERLSKKHDNIELVLVENMNHDDALNVYSTADIIIDQLYIGTYGVFAIEGMALGKPVVTYISKEMKECLPEDLPIVSASIYDLDSELERLIVNPTQRYEIGKKGRTYVESYHDYKKNAVLLSQIYNHELSPCVGREAFERAKNVLMEL